MKTEKSTKTQAKVKEPTAAQLAEGMIISVGETRKLLGNDAKELDDCQIATQVLVMADLAQELLKYKHFAS